MPIIHVSCFICNTKEAIGITGHSDRFDVSIFTMTRAFFNKVHNGVARKLHNNFGFMQLAIKCMQCKFVLITDMPKTPKNSNISLSLTSHTLMMPRAMVSTWQILDTNGKLTKGLSGRETLKDTKRLCITRNPNLGYETIIPYYQQENIGLFSKGETVDVLRDRNSVPAFCSQFSKYFKTGKGLKPFMQKGKENYEEKKVFFTKRGELVNIKTVKPKVHARNISTNPLMKIDDYDLGKSVKNINKHSFKNEFKVKANNDHKNSKFNYKESMKRYMKRKNMIHRSHYSYSGKMPKY